MLEALEMILYFAVAAVIVATTLRDRLTSEPTPDEQREARLEELAAQRARGEIDATEHEKELEFVLDDDNDMIRAVAEDVSGISDARSKAIAREYESLDDLRGSSRERLEGVYGIGEETAGAVLERVQ